jgi:NAD(P)-dependent dehydrogenase (short-subunit alcohol dehydrogenase family)
MDQVAVITGASGGIGRSLLEHFSEAGYLLIAIDVAPAKHLATSSRYLDIDLNRFCVERAYREESTALLTQAVAGRPVRALVNNAAVQITNPVESLTADDWSQTLNVNLFAPFLLTQALLDPLERANGAVVNISSIHAFQTKPGFSAYATSKAGLNGLTRSLAVELGSRVRVNSISPAAVNTPMLAAGFVGREGAMAQLAGVHPAGRLCQPEEVAALALFLASDSARFITGADFAIDGGIGSRLHDPV